MNIDQLQTLLYKMKQAGVSGDTPVVIALGTEGGAGDDENVYLCELESQCVLENVPYLTPCWSELSEELTGTVFVLASGHGPAYENTRVYYGFEEMHCKHADHVETDDIKTITVPEAEWDEVKLSADRWNAMLSAPGIRILGSAGLRDNDGALSNDYGHFGMEIWTHHSGSYDNVKNGGIITNFADKMIRNNARIEGMKVTLPDNLEWARVPFRAYFVGEQTQMGLRDKALPSLLDEHGYITEETAKAAAVRQGITRDVKLVVDYRSDTIKLIVEGVEENDDRFIVTGKFVCDGKEVEFTNEAFAAYNRFGRHDDRDPDIARLTEEARVAGLYGVVRVVPVYSTIGD